MYFIGSNCDANSISVWKRSVIPAQPRSAAEIDISIPFFVFASGESIVKIDRFVKDRRTGLVTNRRLIGYSTEKVIS